jgi:transglutaminase-like putative cysteine protease
MLIVVGLLLILTNVVGIFLYYDPIITELKENIIEIKLENSQLENNITKILKLLDNYENEIYSLNSEKEVLSEEVNQLQFEISDLVEENNYVLNEIEYITSNYNSILNKYTLEKELTIGVTLESYFDTIRQEIGPSIYDNQAKAEFGANLAKHNLGRIFWPYYEDQFSEFNNESSYEIALEKIETIISLIGFDIYHTETEKIEKILVFLNEHIHYEYEINELLLAPIETLAFKSGDCDDYSILCSTLLEYLGIESAIEIFKNDDDFHAMVLVQLKNTPRGFYFFNNLTDYGLSENKWIIIEPQLLYEHQNDTSIGEWSLIAASEIDN